MPAAPLARKEKAMKDNSKFGTCLYIYYKGGVDGEEPVDDHSTGEPFKIVLGAGQVCPGIEDALCDMEVGEEKVVVIPSEEAYGHYQEEGVQTYPRVMFPFGYELKRAMSLPGPTPQAGCRSRFACSRPTRVPSRSISTTPGLRRRCATGSRSSALSRKRHTGRFAVNCFPCKGPACNGCKKFDRINAAVKASAPVRCPACGGKVDLSQGICVDCGHQVIKSPGAR